MIPQARRQKILYAKVYWTSCVIERRVCSPGFLCALVGKAIAAIDSNSAMTSERPYRKAKTKLEAIQESKRCSGTQFDPELVNVFIKISRY
jgi:hypothetical protein